MEYKEEDIRQASQEHCERFKKYIDNYVHRACQMHYCLTSLQEMQKVKRDIWMYGCAFWNYTYNSFIRELVINAYSFFEEYSTQNNVDSFDAFLNYIESNHKKIYCKKFFERVRGKEWQEVEFGCVLKDVTLTRQEIISFKQTDLFKNIKKLRDKIHAHNDKDYSIGDKKAQGLLVEEWKDIHSLASKIINRFNVPFDRRHQSTVLANDNDIKQVIDILETYHSHKREILQLKFKK